MRVRVILVVLALFTFLSSAIGGYLYFNALKASSLQTLERQALFRAENISDQLNSYMGGELKSAAVLAGLQPIRSALERDARTASMGEINLVLDTFRSGLNVGVCYVMDAEGTTLASSNRHDPDSFVGENFSFRPYFVQAMTGSSATYMALGKTSGVRGLYHSHPVYGPSPDRPIGVAVIKSAIGDLESELHAGPNEIITLADPHGVIFLSTRKDWILKTLRPLLPDEIDELARSMQFGSGPWPEAGLDFSLEGSARDADGVPYLVFQKPLIGFTGWTIYYFRNQQALLSTILAPLSRTHGTVIVILCLLVGSTVFILYRKASQDIVRRREAEAALRESEERYRRLYHHTPAILHSIDPDGRLLSVSDYWTGVLGHERNEVLGRKVTEFMTPESRRMAEEYVIPEFMRSGFCRDISYQFIKKNGEVMDVLLSAIAERDAAGTIVRSLAVLVDVTELKKTEEKLKAARDALRSYSQELESAVRQRSGEISSILQHTPAVVYIKDLDGRYIMANSRFGEISGLSPDEMRGKTDFDIFPLGTADQFRTNDLTVAKVKESRQMEETIPQTDGNHIYLSVKFPLLDSDGEVSRICGISTDITLIKKAQEQLRRLSGHILSDQEAERANIARELHDELGQVLTALRLDAVWLRNRLTNLDMKAYHRASAMCDLVDQTIDNVRQIAVRLRPGVLDDLGLVDALEWMIADFESRTDVSFTFHHDDLPEIQGPLATCAYRIAQEALTNVARHAQASRVNVTLTHTENALRLTLSDDGQGFEPDGLADAQGLGLAGMRERAILVGGSLKLYSTPGEGTVIECVLPLSHPLKGEPA